VTAPIAVTMMTILVAVVTVLIAVVAIIAPAERPLGLMDGGADGWPDFLPGCSGLGLGAVRGRGDRLAHVLRPGVARTTVAISVAVVPIAVAAVPAVAAPIAVAAPAPPVSMATLVTVVPASVTAVPAVPVPVTAAAAALARVGPPLAAAPRVPTAPAVPPSAAPVFRVGNVVMDRRERHRQTAKEWDQGDHDHGQNDSPEEGSHGWSLLL